MPRRRNGRASLAIATAPVRAAIYTRKSTDEGLDRDFSSLDNQRERAEAFIESQGWSTLPTEYADGGYSGGTMERPALKRLLDDVNAGLIDTVVCYRLDRISRSLVQFGRIHEFLEKRDVALVSVTESINTTTPHGRMMVNVLLSFAQYERELIAERTRHKIEAARKRGKWTGGIPILGYDTAPEGGRLKVNKAEADQVRAIFDLYLVERSLVKVATGLNRRGWRKKSWTTKTGKHRQGGTWDRRSVRDLLVNPLYVGMQKLGDDTFPGEHRAIVTRDLFDRVQAVLDGNYTDAGAKNRNRHGALLRGLMRCSACGRAMSHAPAKSKGRLYRYYRCNGRQRNGADSCPTPPLPADKVEVFVVEQIKRIGADPELQRETFRQAHSQIKAERRGLKAEVKRLERDLGRSQKDAARLVDALSRAEGASRSAIQIELEKVQEHITTVDARLAEIHQQQANLEAQTIEEADVAAALEDFDELWSVLLTPERERVLKLLINEVTYSGETLSIAWRLAGVAQLAEEVGDGK